MDVFFAERNTPEHQCENTAQLYLQSESGSQKKMLWLSNIVIYKESLLVSSYRRLALPSFTCLSPSFVHLCRCLSITVKVTAVCPWVTQPPHCEGKVGLSCTHTHTHDQGYHSNSECSISLPPPPMMWIEQRLTHHSLPAPSLRPLIFSAWAACNLPHPVYPNHINGGKIRRLNHTIQKFLICSLQLLEFHQLSNWHFITMDSCWSDLLPGLKARNICVWNIFQKPNILW